jgi:tetratricopeptide (TPR) repeat protein
LGYTEILGDYSTSFKHKSWSSPQAEVEKIYWFVSRRGSRFRVSALNNASLPTDVHKIVDAEELMQGFDPEPKHFYRSTLPAIRRRLSERRDPESRKELLKRLGFDLNGEPLCEEHVQQLLADFFEQAQSILERQTGHICAHCVILRKQGRLEEALRLYFKALELTPSDENLHFNIARAYFDQGEQEPACNHLNAALDLNPDFKPAQAFLAYIDKQRRGLTGGNGGVRK